MMEVDKEEELPLSSFEEVKPSSHPRAVDETR
jgi:hypothetical protein